MKTSSNLQIDGSKYHVSFRKDSFRIKPLKVFFCSVIASALEQKSQGVAYPNKMLMLLLLL